jgi:hypothetical protein
VAGFYPDPTICRVGDTVYLANSSFEYRPGVPVHASRDLTSWHLIGHALQRPSQLPDSNGEGSSGIFAPTLRHHDGQFWLITTNVEGHLPEQLIVRAAALALRLDEQHRYEIEIDATRLTAAQSIGGIRTVLASRDLPRDQPIELHIQVEGGTPCQAPDTVTLALNGPHGLDELARLDGRYLSTEVAGGFTGRVIGVAAQGGTATVHDFGYTATDTPDCERR